MTKPKCCCVIAVVFCLIVLSSDAGASGKAAFTVKDAIEMVTFSDPYTRSSDAEAQESPDGHGFVVVTTRGILETNQLESSLWYFSRDELNTFLSRKRTAAPEPRLVFRQRGVPIAMQTNSYGSLITDVRWSSDSSSVMAQVEQPDGNLHLFRIRIATGNVKDLTPGHRVDVRAATAGGGTVAYLFKSVDAVEKSPARDDVAIDRTGQSLYHILFPKSFPYGGPVSEPWRLKIRSSSGSFDLPAQPGVYFPITAVHSFRPVISPDGHYVLTAISVPDIPTSRRSYETAQGAGITKDGQSALGPSGRTYDWPWQYALVDVRKRRAAPLFNAPTGYVAGYGDVLLASWSNTGDRVIVINTYLPIDTQDAAAHSIRPCAIALYDVSNSRASCVVKGTSPGKNVYLLSATFASSGAKIVTQWLEGSKERIRTYVSTNGEWYELSSAIRDTAHDSVRLYLHQDIDEPPTMWASNGLEEKLLWDPNPKIHNTRLGKGSVYTWTDSSGYTWHGGLILPAPL
jgi:hypothetical protein